MDQLPLLDLHTHHRPSTSDVISIRSLRHTEWDLLHQPSLPNQHYSIGIHPWDIPQDYEAELAQLAQLLSQTNVWAVGEAGLDKLTDTPWVRQIACFRAQALLAESVGKPLIIHCVRSYNEVMELYRQISPSVPWIIHGFRGKSQLCHQLQSLDISLSYGAYYHPDSLRMSFAKGLFFVETDDQQERNIRDIYTEISQSLSISVDELIQSVHHSWRQIFGSDPILIKGSI